MKGKESMRFLDLFSGIGGFRLGMEPAGHKCVGYCEIDKYARASYQAIHDTEGEIDYKDITEVTNEEFRKLRGKVDVICGGFPCQAFSIAGNQLGFEDARGTLFYEIARAAEQVKPRYLFLENVRNLLSHDKGKTFERMLKILDELGYDAEWQVLNSKNFGVPQNRERVFIIGHLRGECTYRVFPIRREDEKLNTNGEIKQIGNIGKSDNFGGNPQVTRVYDINGISPTLNTMQGGGREPKILVREATKQGYAVANVGDSINFSHPNSKTHRGRVGKNIANTLLTSDEQCVVLPQIIQKPHGFNKGGVHNIAPTLTKSSYQENNFLKIEGVSIRKLTPRECWRLQGFPDWAFDKAQEVNSNSQLYKQAGNSVTVNVIEEIAKRLR
uniref:Cytosine-specific methyltransferase n=1 Tax=Siphoviridae sp. ctAFE3 TaxID=2827796 RepID=A0A8S5S6J5_9CAUD|nr:MAG TPA: Cytosine specific methyltransferase [Siphoviridae sp. ctAFE3]